MDYPKEYVKAGGRKLLRGGPRDMQTRVAPISPALPESNILVEELKSQIGRLEDRLREGFSAKPEKYFTPEEVDEEVRKAVDQAVKETILSMKKANKPDQEFEIILQKYKTQIVELQRTNDDLTRLHTKITTENSDLLGKINQLEQKLSDNDLSDLKIKIAVLENSIGEKEEMIKILKLKSVSGVVEEDPNRPKLESKFVDPLEEGAGDGMVSNLSFSVKDTSDTEKAEMSSKVSRLKDLLGGLPNKRQ